MIGYLGVIGGVALGLVVMAMFITSFFAGERTRKLIKLIGKPRPRRES